eukprot:10736248-Ditylum_brightwellii.AAC.1
MMLNYFPPNGEVSKHLCPAEIVDGVPKFDISGKHICFGSYAQAYDGMLNTTKERSINAIALHPANNKNGYYFMSLWTGKQFHTN